jgi:MFS transporter, OFA family, oxalate/formate antiporter
MTAEILASARPTKIPLPTRRWVQLVAGLVCMMAISSPQYVWTLFTKPLTVAYGVPLSTLQVTFSILIVLQTFLSPFQGWLVDRFGPRTLISVGSLLTGLSWVLASSATDVTTLYLTYGLFGGIGTGIVYIGVVGLMVRWFPDRRGLAVGTVAAGYGMGALLTTFPISASIVEKGLQSTFIAYGIGLGLVGFVAAQFLRNPPDSFIPAGFRTAEERGIGPKEMVRNPIFWLMFVMMTLMSTSGLMVTSQLAAIAKDAGIGSMLVWGLAAVPLALTIDRICNGLTRPFFGYVSDRIGRENTMFVAFLLEAVAMTLWINTSDNVVLFVLLSGLVFFGWGEIFSLFPSTLTDTFGTRHATVNYGCLYIAQGIGSILGGPLAALLREKTGTWTPVFSLAIGADVLTALLALFVLKAMRQRYLQSRNS